MLAALAIVLCASSAYAASVVFTAAGTTADGATLGGTVTIDTTAGTVTAANVTLGAPDTSTYTFIQAGTGPSAPVYVIQLGTAASGNPRMGLLVPGTTLVGYAGGALCSTSALCTDVTSYVFFGGDNPIDLTAGSLTPVPPPPSTPAPPTWALIGLAILLLAAFTAMSRGRAQQA
jgi:hypothetical protein